MSETRDNPTMILCSSCQQRILLLLCTSCMGRCPDVPVGCCRLIQGARGARGEVWQSWKQAIHKPQCGRPTHCNRAATPTIPNGFAVLRRGAAIVLPDLHLLSPSFLLYLHQLLLLPSPPCLPLLPQLQAVSRLHVLLLTCALQLVLAQSCSAATATAFAVLPCCIHRPPQSQQAYRGWHNLAPL